MPTKQLSFSDYVKHTDKFRTGGDGTTLKGIVTMRDNTTGRVVFSRRNNLILLRGRTFALEDLFKDTIDNNGVSGGANPYLSNLSRKISGFIVGRGGSVAPSTPFEAKAVEPRDRWLTTEIPFRLHDNTLDETTPESFVPAAELPFYADGRAVVGQETTQREYFLKRFDNFDPTWNFDETANEVYKLIQMTISEYDCRTLVDPMVNELALVIAEDLQTVDSNGMPQYTDIEIFSKIHFPTEYLSTGKSLSIEYLVYA